MYSEATKRYCPVHYDTHHLVIPWNDVVCESVWNAFAFPDLFYFLGLEMKPLLPYSRVRIVVTITLRHAGLFDAVVDILLIR